MREQTLTEQEVDAYNRRTMWEDVANHLQVAIEALEHVQGVLADLEVPYIAENLTPTVESVQRFRALAAEKAGG